VGCVEPNARRTGTPVGTPLALISTHIRFASNIFRLLLKLFRIKSLLNISALRNRVVQLLLAGWMARRRT